MPWILAIINHSPLERVFFKMDYKDLYIHSYIGNGLTRKEAATTAMEASVLGALLSPVHGVIRSAAANAGRDPEE